MTTCKDLNIKLCIRCRDHEEHCWSKGYSTDPRIINQSDQDIVKYFFETFKSNSWRNVFDPKGQCDDMYWYLEAIRVNRPHLIEKINNLMILY